VKRTRQLPALLATLGLLLFPLSLSGAAASLTKAQAKSARAPSFVELLAELQALGGRVENSPSERAAFGLIESTCRSAHLDLSSISFDESSDGYSYSRILEARVHGARDDELVVVVPVDSWIDAKAGRDGAVAIALALEEAASLGTEAASGRAPPISVRFVFLGAERRGLGATGEEASLGSRTWIARAVVPENIAVLYLSMDDLPVSIAVENAGAGILSPFWYYDRVRLALEAAGFPLRLEANRMQIYRLGLADSYGPAAPYLAANIPALAIRGQGDAPPADAQTIGESFSVFMNRFLDQNRAGFSDTWDRHYLIFQLGSLSAVVREPAYVAFLVCFSILALGAALLLSVTRREELRAVADRVPIMAAQLFALFLALCAILLAERGAAAIDALIIGSDDFWRLSPRLFMVSRIVSSFFLFLSLLSILVERCILTPNPYFYEFAALVCLAFDIFIFAAIRLPLSFYFVWAFVVVGISLALRRPLTTLVAYGLMYAPLLLLAVELLVRPELSLYRRIIVQGFGGILALAATTLPFFTFAASPLLFYSKHGARARSRAALGFAAVALAIETAALGSALFGAARSSSGARSGPELTLSETLDQDRGEFSDRLLADRRIGKGLLFRGDRRLPYGSSRDTATLSGPDAERRIEIRQYRSFFLDRVTDRIEVDCASAPYAVKLDLRSDSDLQIYDCDLPYRVSLDGKSAEVFAGINPGRRLQFSLTVPRGFRASLVIKADYLHPLVPYRYAGGGSPREGTFSVLATAALRGEAAE